MAQTSMLTFFYTGLRKNCAITFACLFLFAACKKNNDKQPSTDEFDNQRVKTFTGAHSLDGLQEFYMYDAQNRIIKEIAILWNTDTTRVAEYKYSGYKVSRKMIQNNSIQYKYFKLNAQGYISSDLLR